MKKISLIIPLILLASGCSLHGPSLELEPPITFKSGHHSSHQSSRFCPPGQAKKGRC